MLARRLGVLDHDPGLGIATGDDSAGEVEFATRVGALDDYELEGSHGGHPMSGERATSIVRVRT